MRHILGLFLGVVTALSQTPNCSLAFGPWTTTNATNAQQNQSAANQCAYWVLQYQVTGTPTISIQFESAVGATAAGAFAAFTGSIVSGINPSTSTTCTTVTNCVAVFTGFVPWYRVTMTLSGTGTVSGTLQGYKTYQAAGGNTPVGGSACAGTVATPCVVVGNVATGVALAGAPVRIAGSDGTLVRDLKLGTDGGVLGSDANVLVDAAIATSAAWSNGGRPLSVLKYLFNGTTADRDFVCPSSATITYTAANGTVQIVALAAAKIIRVCSIMLSSDTATNITLEYGTGALCATGLTALTGIMPNVLTLSKDWGPEAALRTASANALCIVSSVVATLGGVVTYAQF